VNQKYLWLEVLKFNDQGLIPAIVQDSQDASILSLIWIDKNSLREVIDTGNLNGNYTVTAVFYDCDADALICRIKNNQQEKSQTGWIEL
jgi:phosphoribosyl-AMP cyclohydrolase/phosphoribosyl-ATP pyrophosphohydrolase/phosphoribosyl-AMP cyclohydrolase